MEKPNCAVNGCERSALMLFGNKWICGECYVKIRDKQLQEQNKLIEEIGVTG